MPKHLDKRVLWYYTIHDKMIREVKQMAYVIYLICCAMHGVLMSHMNVSLGQWEYWVAFALMAISYICGREYENKHEQSD